MKPFLICASLRSAHSVNLLCCDSFGFLAYIALNGLSTLFFQGILVWFCICLFVFFPPLSQPTIVKISQSSIALLFISLLQINENSFYFYHIIKGIFLK